MEDWLEEESHNDLESVKINEGVIYIVIEIDKWKQYVKLRMLINV